ncbi:MAG: hypothetical protein ACLU0O_07575 [Collinsella sp.]
MDGCKVDARADGAGIADARVAGMIADGLAVRGGARCRRGRGAPGQGVRVYGVCLLGGAANGGAAGRSLPSMRPGLMRRAPTAASPAWAGRLRPRASWRLRAGLWRRRRGWCRRVRWPAHVTIEPVDTTASAGRPEGPMCRAMVRPPWH